MSGELPDFHPLTVIRNWGNNQAFRLGDALTGVCAFGATGSGKTSGVAKHLAIGYMANDFGGLVLCAKKEERDQWQRWAREVDREDDLVIIDASGQYRFNFLDWEASRAGEGGGLTINIVNLLDELAGAVAGGAGKAEGGGDNRFFTDALHYLNINLVDLCLFAGYPVSLPLLSLIMTTAPTSAQQAVSEQWKKDSECWALLEDAEQKMQQAPEDVRADFAQCKNYWLREFPVLSEKTRSIIVLSFSMLVRPFITRPLRRIFSTDTNIRPEDTFNGKIFILDIPLQEFRLAGRIAAYALKYCFQVAVLRRMKPNGGYLRPVFLWADEAQNFISDFDAEYQAVARSAGGCTVYLTQNRESYRRVLGNDDSVDALLGNLQAKFFCQNSGDTNEWASKLLGERYVQISSTSFSRSEQGASGGASRSEQKRAYVEPARFTTLKRGAEICNFMVECIAYKGGTIFEDGNPYKLLVFKQS